MSRYRTLGWSLFLGITSSVISFAEDKPAQSTPVLHSNYVVAFPPLCDELLPEDESFTEFLRRTARVVALQSKTAAIQALKILTYRDELQMEVNWSQSDVNKADTLIRAYLCHHFKGDDRSQLTSASPQMIGFLAAKSSELIQRIRDEILALQRARWESQELQKEIIRKGREFNALREDVQLEVRESIQRSLKQKGMIGTPKK